MVYFLKYKRSKKTNDETIVLSYDDSLRIKNTKIPFYNRKYDITDNVESFRFETRDRFKVKNHLRVRELIV